MSENNIKYPKIKVKLIGKNGNAFMVLGLVTQALRNAGVSKDEISEFKKQATSGDYNHLLMVCMEWVDVR